MKIAIALVLVASAAGAARADGTCEWYGSYYDNGHFDVCQVQEVVPAGCPVHVVVSHGSAAPRATVERAGAVVDITGTVTANDVTHAIASIDEFSCDCAPTTLQVAFDETTIELVAAQPGETVTVADGSRLITDAAPCPAASWPTTYVERLACDRCPTPPGGDDDGTGDDAGGGTATSGCSSGGGESALGAAFAVLVLVSGSRRRARR